MGLASLQCFFEVCSVVAILASLSIVPFCAFVRRRLGVVRVRHLVLLMF